MNVEMTQTSSNQPRSMLEIKKEEIEKYLGEEAEKLKERKEQEGEGGRESAQNSGSEGSSEAEEAKKKEKELRKEKRGKKKRSRKFSSDSEGRDERKERGPKGYGNLVEKDQGEITFFHMSLPGIVSSLALQKTRAYHSKGIERYLAPDIC
ncbi:hypothetical protein DFH28DRAFT_935757 [Melampsora americana]|nr:hypothetical protein DFH28DRAFT_935757 [Melampsora americana]